MERKEALKLGLKTYENGKPCRYGHIAPRQTSNSTCVICAKDAKARAYAKDPGARKRHNAKYYLGHTDSVHATNKAWRDANQDD